MDGWPILLAFLGLSHCQLHSHLVPPLQDTNGHGLGQHLGSISIHPQQTQAIIGAHHTSGNLQALPSQRHSVTVQSPHGIRNSVQVQNSPLSLNVGPNLNPVQSSLNPTSAEQDVKNHALFYRSATNPGTNKFHRDSKKVEIPGNKTVEEILQWLQTHYKAVNLRKAREDLARTYLPADLSSTQEPRPFQTQKYTPSATTPRVKLFDGRTIEDWELKAPNPYGNQRGTTPRQNVFQTTPGYNVQASQQKTAFQSSSQQGYKLQATQRGYQQPFQPQSQYSPVGQPESPSKTYIPAAQQPSYQPPTQGYQPSPSPGTYPTQQSYQPNQQGFQQPQQGQNSYQPSQQGYQTSSPSYQPSSPTQGYPTSPQYPSSTTRPSYQPSTQPSYTTGQTSGPTQQGYPSGPTQQGYPSGPTQQGYPSGPTQQGYPSGPTQQGYPSSQTPGPSSTYGPKEDGYPQSSKPSPGFPGSPGYYPEPVNTVQPPYYTENDDNQLTNTYPGQNQGSVGPGFSSTGGPQGPTSPRPPGQGFQPEDNQQVGQHPPHIHELKVECSKESMVVHIEFNETFNGVIYSKGHHNEPECRYVQPNSNRAKFDFTLNLNSCGTQYIEDFASGNPAYLENTLVVQNEEGILEIWDYIRNVRCLWEGSITQSLMSTGLSIDGLNQEVVTFSGDTAKAKLELQAGRGPFSYENANLVRIGDLMTLVVSVEGDNGFNIRVGECIATDGQRDSPNKISLTDDRGCTIKEKVMGGFQFTKNPSTGASVAYAFFRAFKFPDVMELAIECSVQLCKTECAPCPDPNQLIEPRRRRRWVQNATDEVFEELRLKNKIQVFLPEELPSSEMSYATRDEQICITPYIFYSTTSLLLFLTSVSTLAWMYFWYKAMSSHRKL